MTDREVTLPESQQRRRRALELANYDLKPRRNVNARKRRFLSMHEMSATQAKAHRQNLRFLELMEQICEWKNLPYTYDVDSLPTMPIILEHAIDILKTMNAQVRASRAFQVSDPEDQSNKAEEVSLEEEERDYLK